MSFARELDIIRRYLRDPTGKLWDNDTLIALYNQAQNDVQNDTRVLEDVAIVPVPPKYGTSYLHDWESGFVVGSGYRALRQQQNFYSCCARFEMQENFGIDGDLTDPGEIAYTHPFEAWFATPNKPPAFPFPDDFHSAKAMFYDEHSIDYRTKRDIQTQNSSWETQQGETQWYYRDDEVSNTFVPYPMPSTAEWNDEAGTGMVTSVEDDTTESEDGAIVLRSGDVLSSDSGAAISVLETDDNFTLFYDIRPRDIVSASDDVRWPAFLCKYVRFRTLELAYLANTDARIPSLGGFWGNRYRLGLSAIRRYLQNKNRDRIYRFATRGSLSLKKSRPRLPDSYPNV